MEKLKFKIRSQYGFIIRHMDENKGKWFTVGDFCGGSKYVPFVGYKASSRLAELQKKGLLLSRWSNQKTVLGGRIKEYMLMSHVGVLEKDGKMKIIQAPLPF